MTLEMELQIRENIGREEGRAEGRTEGRAGMIADMVYDHDISLARGREKANAEFGFSSSEFDALIKIRHPDFDLPS